MFYRQLFVLPLLCLVVSCSSSLPKAAEDVVVVTKKTQSTRMGQWASINTNDFATWDVDAVEEYGFIPNDYYTYDPTKYLHSKSTNPLGVRTMNSNTYVVPKIVPGELAGKMEYWLAREVRNTFYRKVHVTYELSPDFNPNPKQSGQAFYFENTPANDIDRFKAALKQSGIDDNDIPKIIDKCSRVVGWRSLTHMDPNRPEESINWRLKRNQDIRTKKFHERCFGEIVTFSKHIDQAPLRTYKTLPPLFVNSKYIDGYDSYKRTKVFSQYSDNMIHDILDYDVFNKGWFEAGFLEHLKGKYGKDISENLKHNVSKAGFYKKDKLRVMVVLSDATQLLSELNFVNDQYYFTQHDQMNWTSHILKKVFGKRNAKELYRDYYSRVETMQGRDQYTNSIKGLDVLKPLKGHCNFDLSKVHMAYKAVSRFELDCVHKPIKTGNKKLDEKYYQSYIQATKGARPENNVLASHVTLFSLQDSFEIMGTVAPVGVNMTAIQFEFAKDELDMGWNYFHAKENGALVNGKVDSHQPESDLLSNFAMTLAKNFPPNALVSWIPELSSYGYVFHHGILWRFPVADLRNPVTKILG
jgi:hypothetical protein